MDEGPQAPQVAFAEPDSLEVAYQDPDVAETGSEEAQTVADSVGSGAGPGADSQPAGDAEAAAEVQEALQGLQLDAEADDGHVAEPLEESDDDASTQHMPEEHAEHEGPAGGDEDCAAQEAPTSGAGNRAACETSSAGRAEYTHIEAVDGTAPASREEPALASKAAAAPAASASAASASSTGSARRAKLSRLTFSGPPKCLERLPRTAPRANYSHSRQRVRQILRDNDKLVRRLGEIASQPPQHETDQMKHDKYLSTVAAMASSRRRQDANRLMQQNLRIYQRLQEVRPSPDVARGPQERDFAKHERMLATLAALRAKGHGSWVK